MRKMPTRNSGPELVLRKSLHRLGMRYALHGADLPGRPDIVFRSARLAVFVDGCFWHFCPRHCVLPRHNHEWWFQKLSANRRRDRIKDKDLAEIGWVAIHVWEHQNMGTAAARISRVVIARRRRVAGK
jgi:DNA mismatch endonuclease (patch repair protein)